MMRDCLQAVPFLLGKIENRLFTGKQFVTGPEAEYDNKQGDETIAQKQHDTHADADPYEYEAKQLFHGATCPLARSFLSMYAEGKKSLPCNCNFVCFSVK